MRSCLLGSESKDSPGPVVGSRHCRTVSQAEGEILTGDMVYVQYNKKKA